MLLLVSCNPHLSSLQEVLTINIDTIYMLLMLTHAVDMCAVSDCHLSLLQVTAYILTCNVPKQPLTW